MKAPSSPFFAPRAPTSGSGRRAGGAPRKAAIPGPRSASSRPERRRCSTVFRVPGHWIQMPSCPSPRSCPGGPHGRPAGQAAHLVRHRFRQRVLEPASILPSIRGRAPVHPRRCRPGARGVAGSAGSAVSGTRGTTGPSISSRRDSRPGAHASGTRTRREDPTGGLRQYPSLERTMGCGVGSGAPDTPGAGSGASPGGSWGGNRRAEGVRTGAWRGGSRTGCRLRHRPALLYGPLRHRCGAIA